MCRNDCDSDELFKSSKIDCAEGAFRETEHDDDEHTQSVNRT
jgi:hypothetical protein